MCRPGQARPVGKITLHVLARPGPLENSSFICRPGPARPVEKITSHLPGTSLGPGPGPGPCRPLKRSQRFTVFLGAVGTFLTSSEYDAGWRLVVLTEHALRGQVEPSLRDTIQCPPMSSSRNVNFPSAPLLSSSVL